MALPTVGAARRPVAELRSPFVEAVPACLVAGGALLGLATAQGGYFPTSWGWASTAFLWLIGLWAAASGKTEARRLDLAFVGLLALLATWIGLSIAWSVYPASSVLEVQRALVLVAGLVAFLLFAQRRHLTWLVATLLAGITGIAGYALATRLFPDRLGTYDPIAVYRLSEPIGYWNGLGILCVLGLLLACGAVAEGDSGWLRAAAAGSTVVLAATLYFTFSRGAWLALAVGVAFTLVFTPRRLRFVATTLAVAAPAGVGVLLASQSYALTHRVVELGAAVDDGRRLAVVLFGLCAVAAVLAALLHVADRRIEVPRLLRVPAASVLILLALAAGATLVARYGSPVTMAERAWDAFEAAPPQTGVDLNSRLLSFSGNGRVELWTAASDVYADHELVGSGAGSFERLWRERPDATSRVRDAHGLYIETLAELGPIGLGLLLACLATPLIAAVRARRSGLVPATAGAYVAFLVHAGVDWDWELAGLTLAALLIGGTLVVAARPGTQEVLSPRSRIALAILVGVTSVATILGGLGNSALARAHSAVQDRELQKALVQAERARQLMPWSGRPWVARGEAELAAGDVPAAARSFRRALEIDEHDWRAWLDLAIASDGAARRKALARARALYPNSTEITRVARQLGLP